MPDRKNNDAAVKARVALGSQNPHRNRLGYREIPAK